MTRLLSHTLLLLSASLPALALAPTGRPTEHRININRGENAASSTISSTSRRNIFASTITAASLMFLPPLTLAIESTSAAAPTIVSCVTPSDGSPANCVSSSSVRNLEMFMVPWTYDDQMPTAEVLARLKGLIQSDPSMSLVADGDSWVSAKATRNLGTCIDQVDFVIRPDDHVITFQSKQIEGSSSTNDFGANRKRLEDLRKKAGVFGRMGEAMETADTTAREGVGGQLKAFWGLQSGMGYEDVILE